MLSLLGVVGALKDARQTSVAHHCWASAYGVHNGGITLTVHLTLHVPHFLALTGGVPAHMASTAVAVSF